MGNPTKRIVFAASLAVAAIVVPAAATAQYYGYATQNVNVRSGPDRSYPLVGWLQEGTEVEIFGCLDSWRWCDLQGGAYRGWVYSGFLAVPYQGGWATIRDIGPESGLPVLSFELNVYWDSFYTTWPWYSQWPWWVSRPPIYYPPWRPPLRPPLVHPRPPIGIAPGPRPPGVQPPIGRPPAGGPPVATPYPPSAGHPPARPPSGSPPGRPPSGVQPPTRPPSAVPPSVPPMTTNPAGPTPRPLTPPAQTRPPATAPAPRPHPRAAPG